MAQPFLKSLKMLDAKLRSAKRAQWHRDLPFEELVFDSKERAKSLGFGEGSTIYHNSYVYGDVRVGKHTWIGPFTMLDGSGGGLQIGEYCSVSSGVHIYTHDTVKWAVSRGQASYERAPVRIEDCCYIGSQAIIAKGVTIGAHSVVGAGAFVKKDVPPYSVVAGIPARVIGRVEVKGENVRFIYKKGKQR